MADPDSLAAVKDFEVEHKLYGKVSFPGTTDVRGLKVDDIVQIEARMFEIYPDGTDRPTKGTGLNKDAIITLYACWPSNKNRSHVQTRDQGRLKRYEKALRGALPEDSEFINYDYGNGNWSFRMTASDE